VLRPSKHSHPDRTVVHLALVLLDQLKTERIGAFDSLRTMVTQRVSGSEPLLLPALNLLFLLGLIEYRPSIDSFEYVGPE